jgi:hypothetical protein
MRQLLTTETIRKCVQEKQGAPAARLDHHQAVVGQRVKAATNLHEAPESRMKQFVSSRSSSRRAARSQMAAVIALVIALAAPPHWLMR